MTDDTSQNENERSQPVAELPTETPSATEVKKKDEYSIFGSKFGKWVMYRFPALLAWVWLLLKLTDFPIRQELAPYRPFLLAPFLVSWTLMVLSLNWLRAVFYYPYFLIFPFILGLRVLIRLARLARRGVVLPGRALRLATSWRAILFVVAALCAGWTTAALARDPALRAQAAIVGHASLYILFLQSFRWAANPYRPMLTMVEFLDTKGRDAFEKSYIQEALADPKRDKKVAVAACRWCIRWLDRLYSEGATHGAGITGFARGSILPISCLGFFLLFVLMATSFASTHRLIDNAWGLLVVGLGDAPTSISYFYFSFLCQATAVPDGIRPTGPLGQLWILWLVSTGILFLTVLIAVFTTSLGVHGEAALADMRAFYEGARRDLVKWELDLDGLVIDADDVRVEKNITPPKAEL